MFPFYETGLNYCDINGINIIFAVIIVIII